LRQHPDWRMIASDGKAIDGRVCWNSGYLEYMKQMLSEMLAYRVDGFHLDMLDQGFGPPHGCWCASCRARFQAEFARPLPKGVTWDEDWDRMLEFRYRSSQRFEQALRDHVKAVNPRATVDFNYHGNPPFSWEVGQRPVQHAGNGDFNTGETGVWGFSALGVALNAEFYRAATPAQRFQVAMQRGVRMYHDQTTRPLNDMRWELFTLLAHGALVTMVDKTAYDGWLDPVAYERIGAAFLEARAKREHFGQQPLVEVGVYFSSRTRDWLGRERPTDYFQAFLGAHKACAYEHLAWGVLLDENASLPGLQRFPVVALPNVAILSDQEVALLRRYVEGGGNLLVTGQSGTFGRRGEKLEQSMLSELIGAKLRGRLDSLDNWLRLPAEADAPTAALCRDIPRDWPFLVKGPAVIYEPTTARPVGQLLKPQRTVRQRQGKEGTDWPMSADVPVGPAMLVNRLGKGVVLTLAGSPDFAAASEHHVVEARRLLRNAVRFLNPRPRIEIAAPVNVEAVVTDDPERRTLRVHLLAYAAPAQATPANNRPYVLPALIEDAPTFRVSVEANPPIAQAEAFNKTTTIRHVEGRVEATVSDVHDVLLLKY